MNLESSNAGTFVEGFGAMDIANPTPSHLFAPDGGVFCEVEYPGHLPDVPKAPSTSYLRPRPDMIRGMASSRPPQTAAPPIPSERPVESSAPVAARSPAAPSRSAGAVESDERETIYAVLGNTTRTGPWLPPERLLVVAVFGSVTLDFRHADLPPGVTEIEVWSVFGSVEIHVPSDLEADLDGFALLGSVEQHAAKGGKLRTHAKRLLGLDDPAADIDALARDAPASVWVRQRSAICAGSCMGWE